MGMPSFGWCGGILTLAGTGLRFPVVLSLFLALGGFRFLNIVGDEVW
jgi:hypothetical protein